MKTSNYRFLVALLGAAALGTGAAMAMPPGPMPFGVLDADGDGKVSQEEFHQARQERWSTMAKQGRLLRNQANAPAFEGMDADGDGYLSEQELRTAQAEHMQQRMQQRRAMRPRMGRQAYPGGRRGPPSFSDFDRDGNGVITEQEFQQTRGERRAARPGLGYPMRQAPAGPATEDGGLGGYGAPMPGEYWQGRYPCGRW